MQPLGTIIDKIKISFFAILLILASFDSRSSGFEASRPVLYLEGSTAYAVFNVSWDNSWDNDRNHDGIWLFFKSLLKEGGYRHISVLGEGHVVVTLFTENGPSLDFEVPGDGVGLFLFPASKYRGKIEATLKVMLDPGSFEGLDTRNSQLVAYGIEMVKIPRGGFEVGDPDQNALRYGAFYRPDKNGEFGGVVKIQSETQNLTVSENGDLFYQAPEGYEGDQTGTIPASYPKGVAPFYIMKYEPTEGQYADFLNSLNGSQVSKRLIFNEEGYYEQGGTITEIEGSFTSKYPGKPCMFMGWDDAMAYADWAGLRPMTEFEYTKAARGISAARQGEFPWGTNTKEQMQRLPDENGLLVMINGWDESKLAEENKKYFGASYYWVMDLSGSMWERVVTVGHDQGRKFTGSHGDGLVSPTGEATNINWPKGNENSGGIGFRGGGFYGYAREYHEFNPFSPIAYRPYGGWQGGMRAQSYGARFIRSID